MATTHALTPARIARLRLRNQRLIGAPFAQPAQAIGFLGAMQAQDYAGAKWGLAQRLGKTSDAELDAAFERGEFLRTHVLRPTWHFVLPADIRWLLALTAPRINAVSAPYFKRSGLDERTFARSQTVLEAALRGGRYRTRSELAQLLADAGISAAGERLSYLMMRAELDALICSGPRRGKQFTYALLAERAPGARTLGREAALAELARRYFQSHGPATAHDFAWWSGLTVTDARTGIAQQPELEARECSDRTYFAFPATLGAARKPPALHLLPNYDEHVIAYKSYAASLDPALAGKLARARVLLSNHLIVCDGLVIGGWRRTFEQGRARLEAKLLARPAAAQRKAIEAAAQRYARFLGLAVEVSLGA